MTTINISLSDEDRDYLEACAARAGCVDAGQYVQRLIAADRQRREDEETERALLNGLASGAATEFTDGDWTEVDAEVEQRIQRERDRGR